MDRLLHILRAQSAGDNELADAVNDPGPGLHQFPVESFSRCRHVLPRYGESSRTPAITPGRKPCGLEKEVAILRRHGFCVLVCLYKPRRVLPDRPQLDPIRQIVPRGRRKFSPDSCGKLFGREVRLRVPKKLTAEFRALVAMQLHCSEADCFTSSRTWSSVSLTKTPIFSMREGYADDRTRGFYSHMARALRIEDETQSIRAGIAGRSASSTFVIPQILIQVINEVVGV